MKMRPGMRRAVWVLGLSAVLTISAVHAAPVSRAGRSTESQPTGAGSHPPVAARVAQSSRGRAARPSGQLGLVGRDRGGRNLCLTQL
jgi:hypothetical protein